MGTIIKEDYIKLTDKLPERGMLVEILREFINDFGERKLEVVYGYRDSDEPIVENESHPTDYLWFSYGYHEVKQKPFWVNFGDSTVYGYRLLNHKK